MENIIKNITISFLSIFYKNSPSFEAYRKLSQKRDLYDKNDYQSSKFPAGPLSESRAAAFSAIFAGDQSAGLSIFLPLGGTT